MCNGVHTRKKKKKTAIEMDNIVATANDSMVNIINFGLPEESQYVHNPKGHKNIIFYISAEDNTHLDLNIVILFATLQNTNGYIALFCVLRRLTCNHAEIQGKL